MRKSRDYSSIINSNNNNNNNNFEDIKTNSIKSYGARCSI
jgi:hypothetical protein